MPWTMRSACPVATERKARRGGWPGQAAWGCPGTNHLERINARWFRVFADSDAGHPIRAMRCLTGRACKRGVSGLRRVAGVELATPRNKLPFDISMIARSGGSRTRPRPHGVLRANCSDICCKRRSGVLTKTLRNNDLEDIAPSCAHEICGWASIEQTDAAHEASRKSACRRPCAARLARQPRPMTKPPTLKTVGGCCFARVRASIHGARDRPVSLYALSRTKR